MPIRLDFIHKQDFTIIGFKILDTSMSENACFIPMLFHCRIGIRTSGDFIKNLTVIASTRNFVRTPTIKGIIKIVLVRMMRFNYPLAVYFRINKIILVINAYFYKIRIKASLPCDLLCHRFKLADRMIFVKVIVYIRELFVSGVRVFFNLNLIIPYILKQVRFAYALLPFQECGNAGPLDFLILYSLTLQVRCNRRSAKFLALVPFNLSLQFGIEFRCGVTGILYRRSIVFLVDSVQPCFFNSSKLSPSKFMKRIKALSKEFVCFSVTNHIGEYSSTK